MVIIQGVVVCVVCVLYVMFVNPHQLHKNDYICASVHVTYCVPMRVFLCGCVCTPEWLSVVAVENTNLANTSKAVRHVGAALLEAPLTHSTSQHFGLFTVAHAKPPLHLKSLQHVVNSLPKGNLHFSPPGYTACQKHKRRKLPLCCFRRCCV